MTVALIDGAAEKKRRTSRQWYLDNKSKKVASDKARRQQRKLELVMALGGKCADCLGEFPSCVYDFHHPDGDGFKGPPPSKLIALGRLTPLKELTLLCANCHRLRHHDNSID